MAGIRASLGMLLAFLACLWCFRCLLQVYLAQCPGWPIQQQYILNLWFPFLHRGPGLCNKLTFKILSENNYLKKQQQQTRWAVMNKIVCSASVSILQLEDKWRKFRSRICWSSELSVAYVILVWLIYSHCYQRQELSEK